MVHCLNCFYWSKIQNLKANHNERESKLWMETIAFTGQRYKIWKQITTPLTRLLWLLLLLLLVKDTKFESKSQREKFGSDNEQNCFYWSKIQNLKANHNFSFVYLFQPLIAFTGQRYKIWKQITTRCLRRTWWWTLLLLVKDTKFESKSQLPDSVFLNEGYCFYWSKIQNLKANHNILLMFWIRSLIAFTGQRYKIWKQITTISLHYLRTS